MNSLLQRMQRGGRRKRKKPEPTKTMAIPAACTGTGTPSISPPPSPVQVKKERMQQRSTTAPDNAGEAKPRRGGKAKGDDGRYDRLQRLMYVASEEDTELVGLMNKYYSSSGGKPHNIAELAWRRGNELDSALEFYTQAKLEIANLEEEKKTLQDEASTSTAKLLEMTDKLGAALAKLAKRTKHRTGTKSVLTEDEEDDPVEDYLLGTGKVEEDNPPLTLELPNISSVAITSTSPLVQPPSSPISATVPIDLTDGANPTESDLVPESVVPGGQVPTVAAAIASARSPPDLAQMLDDDALAAMDLPEPSPQRQVKEAADIAMIKGKVHMHVMHHDHTSSKSIHMICTHRKIHFL
jgi:hypothetical protein